MLIIAVVPAVFSASPGFGATIAVLSLGQVVCWAALFYAFSAFVLPMQAELGWSAPQLMGAYSVGLGLWGLMSYGVGAAIDHGHARAVLTGGPLVAGFGFALWAVAQQPWHLYLAWSLLGVAMAMTLYEPVFAMLAKRYPGRYREALTTVTLVGGLASTLAYPAVAALQSAFGWRAALWVIAAVLFGVIAPLHAWALRGAGDATTAAHRSGSRTDATLAEALRERAFWLLTLAFTLYAFAAASLWAHVMPALADKGLSPAQAVAVLIWVGPAQVGGRLFFLHAARRLGLRALGVTVLSMVALALAWFAWAQSWWALTGFAVLFGLGNGLVTIVRGNLLPELYGAAHVGRIAGALNGIALLARAAAPLMTAWAVVVLGGYRALFVLLALLGVGAVIAFALARRPPPA